MIRNKSFDNIGFLLYLIAVPIGNLKEFNERALSIIKDADLVAAEDTRNAKDLLNKFNIKKEFFSLHEHNEVSASLTLIKKIKDGLKVVYMSDAGYPCISDPGNLLVKKCIENGIKVSSVSGSSASLNALVTSNLNTSQFLFYGFLSAKENEAKKELENLINEPYTLIFYESPHRIKKTIEFFYEVFGNRKICLSREITKINEESIYGNLEEFRNIDFETIKGEIVVIIEGNNNINFIDEKEIKTRINYFLSLNITTKDLIDIICYEFKIKKNEVKKFLPNYHK